MRHPLPSTKALTAFEAAARHGNFTRAAAELALTESAVSRQVALLESMLGLPLFTRVKQRVVLTPAGRAYAASAKAILDRIERETLGVMAHRGEQAALELAVLPTFASEWLIPRMSDFRLRHPHVEVSMGASAKMFLFEETAFDAAIHFGQSAWPGAAADRLFGERLLPVCRPGLADADGDPARLLRLPLLHSSTRPDDWARWFEQAGVADAAARAMQGARFELHSMAISAAAAGHGVALMPDFLVRSAIDAGRLAPAARAAIASEGAYYLVYPENRPQGAALQAFRGWLLAEAAAFRGAPGGGSDPLKPGPAAPSTP
ncbi:LysR substrate-binding domain-containing protein [Pigmentiphaga soli]|uniref:LysR substrate-binding domain-containing protein n=1 Tax=Pigmentiphaga soli TaxID=1007095 RepID=A0ABP8GF75_9BURK